jgi:hypothetical protein
MPAYAKDGNVVCFFPSARKVRASYATFGVSDEAALGDGHMWPDRVRIQGSDARRRGKDLRARDESRELWAESLTLRPWDRRWGRSSILQSLSRMSVAQTGRMAVLLAVEADGAETGGTGQPKRLTRMFANLDLEKCRESRWSGGGITE